MGIFGCCCCSKTFNVKGCGVNQSGVLVQVKAGSTVISSGTTDGSGNVTLDIGSPSTYTVVRSKAGWLTNSQSLTLTCGGTQNVTINPPSGYSCLPDSCCPEAAETGFPYYVSPVVYPSTLYINDGFGLVTLTQLTGTMQWRGTAARTASNRYTISGGFCTATAAGLVTVTYNFQCIGPGNAWILNVDAPGCSSGGLTPSPPYPLDTGAVASPGGVNNVTAASTACPPAFTWSGTVPVSSSSPAFYVFGSSVACTGSQ